MDTILNENSLNNEQVTDKVKNSNLDTNLNENSLNNEQYTKVTSRRNNTKNNKRNTAQQPGISDSKSQLKIIGELAETDVKFQAKRPLIKKRIFYVGNANNANSKTITSHLKKHDVDIISIHPIISREQKNQLPAETDFSTFSSSSFRLCIYRKDTNKVLNPRLWPSSIIVKDWLFKKMNTNSNDNIRSEIIENTHSNAQNNSDINIQQDVENLMDHDSKYDEDNIRDDNNIHA